jgi:hypothetical protein
LSYVIGSVDEDSLICTYSNTPADADADDFFLKEERELLLMCVVSFNHPNPQFSLKQHLLYFKK